MKKIFFIIFFLTAHNSISEQKILSIANVNSSIITNIDIGNEIKLLRVLNKNISLNEDDLKQSALENIIEEILKNSEIKQKKMDAENKKFIDNRYNKLVQEIEKKSGLIAQNLKNKIYQKIKTDHEWNDLIAQKYSWMVSVNMSEIDEKLNQKKGEYEDQNKFLAEKERLIMTEKNKKLNTYSIMHLEKIKRRSLIKFF